MEKQVMQSRSKGASVWVVWMDGWMDGCGLLLEAMVFSFESSMSLFFRHGYPPLFSFSLFFGSCFFGMPSFHFLGNHNLTLFYFRDVLRERLPRHGALLMGNGWMMVVIPNVGMSQMDGSCMCLWSRKHEKHLTRFVQFHKTQQNVKQHMCKVFRGM